MSSPFRIEALALAGLLLPVALGGCDRHDRQAMSAPAAQQDVQPVVVSELRPGGVPALPEDPHGKIYDGDPVHIANGKRYFNWYNCSGCHFNGGGGIGPAFMDKAWIYGGRIDQIYNTIAEGRPNGMPTWRGKIPDSQIWEIAAYVRSLSTPSVKGEEPPTAPPPPSQPPADPNHQGGTTVSEATIGPPPK
jgi:cytochrome c oxidase cbb3-type subunit 3